MAEGVLEPRNPMVGSFPVARAASGQDATAPPRSVINSRRLMEAFPTKTDDTIYHIIDGARRCTSQQT
jgi:hypothetical protein